MVLFVVMNTASLQLIPLNMAAMRQSAGSAQPFAILPAVWITSAASLAVCLAACKLLERSPYGRGRRRRPAGAGGADSALWLCQRRAGVRHLPLRRQEGLRTSLKLLPTLVGLLVAVSMVRASGLLELLCVPLAPVAESLGVSPELLPLALLRPISGSGASAYTLDLLQRFGPDSPTGQMASVLSSSTETTFYAVAVYFGACGYRRLRHTLPAALLGDFTALVFSILTVKLLG